MTYLIPAFLAISWSPLDDSPFVSLGETVGHEFANKNPTDLSFLPFVYQDLHLYIPNCNSQNMQTFYTIIHSLVVLRCPFRARKLPTVA